MTLHSLKKRNGNQTFLPSALACFYQFLVFDQKQQHLVQSKVQLQHRQDGDKESKKSSKSEEKTKNSHQSQHDC